LDIVKRGLGSVGRLRIIEVLVKNPKGLTRSVMVQQSGLRHDDIMANLQVLIRIGWIKKVATKPVKYRLNINDYIVNSLIEFFQIQHILFTLL
jgi:hypothetical protein